MQSVPIVVLSVRPQLLVCCGPRDWYFFFLFFLSFPGLLNATGCIVRHLNISYTYVLYCYEAYWIRDMICVVYRGA